MTASGEQHWATPTLSTARESDPRLAIEVRGTRVRSPGANRPKPSSIRWMDLFGAILQLGRDKKPPAQIVGPSSAVPFGIPAAGSSRHARAAHHRADDRSGKRSDRTARRSPKEDLANEIEAQLLGSRNEADRVFLSALQRAILEEGIGPLPMPHAVLQVQRLIDSPDCQLEELARAIEQDPALATKIVGIANSPLYAGMQPIRTVQAAVLRIGLYETRNITMAIGLHSKVFRVRGLEGETARLWRHALAASIATRAIAAEVGLNLGLGYLGGLLHEVGSVAILTIVADVQCRSRGQFCPAGGYGRTGGGQAPCSRGLARGE